MIVGILGWIGWSVTLPVPGTKMADQGREHVSPQAVADFKFNSNPPTSGSHLATWVRGGSIYFAAKRGGAPPCAGAWICDY